jgi:hypothetical protein
MLLFFGLLLLGFAYLWRFGYLDWVHVRKPQQVDKPMPSLSGQTPANAPLPSQPLVHA